MSSESKRSRLKKGDLRTFGRLLSFAKPYTKRLIIGALCSLVGGGSMVAMFLGAQQLLGFIFDNRAMLHPEAVDVPAQVELASPVQAFGGALASPEPISTQSVSTSHPSEPSSAGLGITAQIAGKFISPKDLQRLENAGLSRLLAICGIMLVIIILNSLAYFASLYFLQWVGQKVVMDLRVKLFAHLQELSVAFYNSTSSGDMISRTVADTQLLQSTVTNVVTDMVRQPIMLVIVFSYIVVIEWRLALFSIILFPTVIVPIILIGRRLRRISREGQRRLAEITSVMKESLDGVMVVKAFGQEVREAKRFTEQCHSFFRRMVSATKAKALSDPITHTIGGLGGIGVLLYAMIAKMPILECVVFACAIWALYEPVKKLGRISMEIQQSSAAADRIFEILDAPITVFNASDAVPVSGPLESLEFKDVSFSYGERQVFSNLNLKINAGESVAIVGPSGGGKTTIVSLILRFFDPVSGALLRNGVDIRKFTIESLRATIGLVMQDTFLFNATIAENIAYGCPDASPDQIEHAAKLAHAHEFIMQKEQGYDTVVGERGVSLSGGQKQRLAIARALLRNPSVLILDEATSSLDTESERNVQAAIDELMGRMTIIVIAHRLSTIAKCDHVAVIANGGVAEYGTQAELLSQGGIYSRLHNMQFGG